MFLSHGIEHLQAHLAVRRRHSTVHLPVVKHLLDQLPVALMSDSEIINLLGDCITTRLVKKILQKLLPRTRARITARAESFDFIVAIVVIIRELLTNRLSLGRLRLRLPNPRLVLSASLSPKGADQLLLRELFQPPL